MSTHVIQTVIEMPLTSDEEVFICKELKGHVSELAIVRNILLSLKDSQGTHVIQKAILSFHGDCQTLIMEEVIPNFSSITSNSNGLCVIKRLLALSIKESYKQYQSLISSQIAKDCINITQNPYGNYAIQILLETFDPACKKVVIQNLKGKIVQLSMIKYSSNVVERAMENSDQGMREKIISEFIESDNFLGIAYQGLFIISSNEE